MAFPNTSASKTAGLEGKAYEYLLANSLRETPVQIRCREKTATLARSVMQTSMDEAQFFQLLIKLMGVKKIIEVGVFTGYSSLSCALALPDDGKIVACDVSEEWTNIAREFWEEAKVAHKIDLRLAPAQETLDAMIAAGESGTYDFAFIDADKANYDAYYERCLTLLRKGGLLAVDNAMWSGKVADPSIQDDDTVALRNLNAKIHKDDRVTTSLLGIADGVYLCLKN